MGKNGEIFPDEIEPFLTVLIEDLKLRLKIKVNYLQIAWLTSSTALLPTIGKKPMRY